MQLPGWAREPLVHFLIAGSLIYLFFLWQGEGVDPTSRLITVDRVQQAQLALSFERVMGRAPSDAELDRLIDRYIRDEVLYREALRLGLDRNDAVVRRRLAQKMDILATSRLEAAVPNDQVLQDWLDQHPQRFGTGAKYSFDQLWFATRDAAQAQLDQINQPSPSDGDRAWRDAGGGISLPRSMDDAPRDEILSQFGVQFAQHLETIKIDPTWQGPIASGLGWHLVRLRGRQSGSVPALDEVRAQVINDWRNATMEQRRQDAYQLLRGAYRVDIAQ